MTSDLQPDASLPDASHPSSTDWPDLAGRIEGAGHVLPVRVYYEDTDFSGVVYHASYLRFMERGRTDMLRLAGVGHAALGEAGLAFAVRRMRLDFLKPARIDASLDVRTRLHAIKGASLALLQTVGSDGVRLVEAEVEVVLIDDAGRPKRLPCEVREALAAYAPIGRPAGPVKKT